MKRSSLLISSLLLTQTAVFAGTIMTSALSPGPLMVVRVHPFLQGETDSAVVWTAIAAERKTVELLDNTGCIVLSHLVRRDSLQRPLYQIHGKVDKKDSLLTLTVRLCDTGDRRVSSASLNGGVSRFKRIRNVLGEAVLHGLDFDVQTSGGKPPGMKTRGSAVAYACLLAAKIKIAGGQTGQAIELLLESAAEDPSYQLSCRMLAGLYRKKGVFDSADRWASRAKSLDSIAPAPEDSGTMAEESPLDALLMAMKKAKTVLLDTGLTCRHATADLQGITAIVWSINPRLYSINIVMQNRPAGMRADELPPERNLKLAVNGGYFEMNGSYGLSPSGLIIADGCQVAPLTAHGGSAVLTLREHVPKFVRAKEFSPQGGYALALQAGPMLVEKGGLNGIITNDRVRLNRAAIGIAQQNVVVAITFGENGKGLCLYDFGEFLRMPLDKGGAACDCAMNLDGGASTQARSFAGTMLIDVKGLWAVNSVITVKKR